MFALKKLPDNGILVDGVLKLQSDAFGNIRERLVDTIIDAENSLFEHLKAITGTDQSIDHPYLDEHPFSDAIRSRHKSGEPPVKPEVLPTFEVDTYLRAFKTLHILFDESFKTLYWRLIASETQADADLVEQSEKTLLIRTLLKLLDEAPWPGSNGGVVERKGKQATILHAFGYAKDKAAG